MGQRVGVGVFGDSGITVGTGAGVGSALLSGVPAEVRTSVGTAGGGGTVVAVGMAANVACTRASTVASRFAVGGGNAGGSAGGTEVGVAAVPQASATKAINSRRAGMPTLNICMPALLHIEIGVGSHGMGFEGNCTQG